MLMAATGHVLRRHDCSKEGRRRLIQNSRAQRPYIKSVLGLIQRSVHRIILPAWRDIHDTYQSHGNPDLRTPEPPSRGALTRIEPRDRGWLRAFF